MMSGCAIESCRPNPSAEKSLLCCTVVTELKIDLLHYTFVAERIPHEKVLQLVYAYLFSASVNARSGVIPVMFI